MADSSSDVVAQQGKYYLIITLTKANQKQQTIHIMSSFIVLYNLRFVCAYVHPTYHRDDSQSDCKGEKQGEKQGGYGCFNG